MELLVDQLRHHAAAHPDRVAYVDLRSGEEITFAGWDGDSNRLARDLVGRGVAPGDRVALHLEGDHVLRWISAYSAIHKAGAVAVPTNTRLSERELATVLGHADPVQVITSAELAPSVRTAHPAAMDPRSLLVVDGPDWDAALDHPADEFQVPVTGDDLADIMYTSGTTGLPKGIAVRHANTHIIPTGRPPWTGESWLHCSPLFTFAGISFVYNPMKMGMTALYLPRFDPDAWFDAVEDRRPTMAFLVPATAQLLAGHERFAVADLTSLQLLSIGSAPLPPSLHVSWSRRLPDASVTNNYSMSEAGTAFTYLPREDVERKAGSVGVPVGTEIRITREDGSEAPAGEVGEVWIRVGDTPREYYRDPEATSRTWHGGWLCSGDLGRVDDDGYLFIVGRAKDVIIRGGNNIHAADVEAVLYEHPEIAEAAVAAVPHEVLGEDVGAWVARRAGSSLSAGEVVSHCSERLADYKVPRTVTFVDALPRNPTGKVLKRELPPPAGRVDRSGSRA